MNSKQPDPKLMSNKDELVIGSSRFPFRLQYDSTRTSSKWWVTIISIVMALLFCAVLMSFGGMNPFTVYAKMFTGAFGSTYGFSETIVKAIPLLLCGLGVAAAYRMSLWNIGAEGQFIMGAIGAASVTILFPDLSGALYIPFMVLGGILGGAAWGLLTAIPKAYFGVNELISSLMLNYIALLFLDYLVYGPWRDPKGFNFPGSKEFELNQQLITLFGTRVHIGILFALIAVVLFSFFMNHTRWGYEMRIIGSNPNAASYAGMNINKQILVVMMISGGLAGLAGASEVSGVTHRLMYGISPGYGYTAIIVAWIAKLNPWGMIVSSVMFGGLIVGGYSVQTIGLPSSMSLMLQGAMLFFLIGGDMAGRFRIIRHQPKVANA
ncbi:simple sugar transport system permease protein [Paenibacillus sp. DS2015]|uniref:ABC transporter permease n=1 Tax=Paenibacillus sp. DS2015 TaxID=3373917 RepID=UPI003D257A1B